MIRRVREDVRTALEKDPAARTHLEVLLFYQGLHAIWLHRVAHRLWTHGFRHLARFVSHASRFLTGIEIHPGAEIGRRVFIDHGGGTVIGETAEIGDDVLLYHGCTLGGTSNEPTKRHPTVGDNVVIGAGSTLLGPIEIGHDTRIGANSVVLESHPPHSTIVGIPAKSVRRPDPDDLADLEHGDLPDPVHEELRRLHDRVDDLESRVASPDDDLESAPDPADG